MTNRKVTKAVIPAAGFGTRFLPQTKAMPKEMLPIVDKPVIQYVVEEAVESGITDIVIVTGALKRAIEDHFDAPNAELVKNLHASASFSLCEVAQPRNRRADSRRARAAPTLRAFCPIAAQVRSELRGMRSR